MKIRLDDQTVVDTTNATASYEGATDWDGNNHITRSTHSQWIDQTLYRSRKGRYYTVTVPRIQGRMPHAEWLSPEAAAAWLVLNDHEVPEELGAAAEKSTE